ncbi:hypothetical protein RCC89_13400 [Cytophagaceae bacterium ABcell3]|nr:hypothetical protein RCC89_13400 [Cytophagaceae bacterium ABcell3]
MMIHNWSQLRPLSKLDQLAEVIIKTAFLLSDNHHVITTYAEHKGANFRVKNRVGEQEFDVLCRQINIDKTTYTYISKSHLEQGIRDDLYIGLVIFIDGQKPYKYLIPSTIWKTPNMLFTDTALKHSEYGININKKTFPELAKYAFEEQLTSL